MFSLWYLSLAIDEYRRKPVFKTASVATNGKAQQPSSPVVTAQKDNEQKIDKIEPKEKKAVEKIDIAVKTPEPEPKKEPELKPKSIKDPFDAKLNELVNKQQPKLPAKVEQFDEKLAEISSIISPSTKTEVKPTPNVEIPDKTPKTPPASPTDEKQAQDTYPSSNFPEPFEATLADFSSDFDAAFDAPKSSNTFKQFQDPFDTKLTEINSKLNQPLSNVDTLQEEDPLDRKLRELSTKYNEKLESTKNIKLPDLETTFEDITRLS